MSKLKLRAVACACGAALLASGCGGGGGGGSGGGAGGGTTTTPVAPAEQVNAVQIQGIVSFESIPIKPEGGLNYAAQLAKPARQVRVEIADEKGKVLASGRTSDKGAYQLNVPANTKVELHVLADMAPPGDTTGKPVVEVADNTNNSLHGATTPAFSSGSKATMPYDVLIKSGWLPIVIDGAPVMPRVAAPFAILDTIYTSQAKVLRSAPATVFPPLTVFWSTANTASKEYEPAKGLIESTQFFMNTKGAPVLLLEGMADVNTDEYDPAVITHEWGHYFQQMFSREDSPGGTHSTGDLLDRSLAFSEGWAMAWAGIALDQNRLAYTYGKGQAQGGTIDLATAPATTRPGWFNEESVRHLLYKLNLATGTTVILDTLKGPFRSAVASTGIHSFNAALAQLSKPAADSFAALLTSQSINPAADAWGLGETNDGGSELTLPMVRQLDVGGSVDQVCVTNAFDPYGEGNKLGELNYLRFTVSGAAAPHQLSLAGPDSTSPAFTVRNAGGIVLSSAAIKGVTAAGATLQPGEYQVVVRDSGIAATPPAQSPATHCFTASLQ